MSLLRRLRTGVLVGFPSEIGLVRFVWLRKLRKHPLRSYENPDANTQEMEYSASWLTASPAGEPDPVDDVPALDNPTAARTRC